MNCLSNYRVLDTNQAFDCTPSAFYTTRRVEKKKNFGQLGRTRIRWYGRTYYCYCRFWYSADLLVACCRPRILLIRKRWIVVFFFFSTTIRTSELICWKKKNQLVWHTRRGDPFNRDLRICKMTRLIFSGSNTIFYFVYTFFVFRGFAP